MRNIWQLSSLMLALLSAGSFVGEANAQTYGRAAVAGRQKVRAALATAMADGTLDREEQYSVLLKGKDLLSPGELKGLQGTLDRLAESTMVVSDTVEAPTPEPKLVAAPVMAGASMQQKFQTPTYGWARQASYQDETTSDGDLGPFKEEPLPDETPTPRESYQQYCDECCESEGCYSVSLGRGAPSLCVQTDVLSDRIGEISFGLSVDAFKGPMDLDNQNGNFGLNFSFNSGLAVFRNYGIGFQVGTSEVLSDFHGTQYTGSKIRNQNFTTIGLYHRNPHQPCGVNFGFAFDWLHDNYYSAFNLSQWRIKLGYEFDPFSELGLAATIPNDGETIILEGGPERFKPVSQGSIYYTRNWMSGATFTGYVGIAEEPGQFLLGGNGRVPLTESMSLVGNLNYILPSASGIGGQDEEMWNLAIGIELIPCRPSRICGAGRFAPLFSLANNGTFAVRRY